METKEIDGVLYKLVPEEREKSCSGCVFKDPDGAICTILTKDCNRGLIYKKVDEPISNSRLKPFNLEEAKAGKPVYTRDGHKARIICFDFRDVEEICCLIAAVDYGKAEKIYYYDSCGKYRGGDSSKYDLMMLPEKKEGWMNIYGYNHKVGALIYNSKEEALNNKESNAIDTVKIEWRE